MSVTEKIFEAPDVDGTADQLAYSMPKGRVWESKFISGSNLRALIAGAANPFNLAEQKIEELSIEFDINKTTLLIDEWEESVGLPDDCLGQASDIGERRRRVIQRLKKKPEVTLSDLQTLVDVIFPTANIELFPGSDYYTLEYTLEAPLLGDVAEKFILVARVPSQQPLLEYTLEATLTGALDLTKLRCYLERVMPANVYLIIEEVGE